MPQSFPAAGWRSLVVLAFFCLVAVSLVGRAVYLQVVDQGFLVGQGEERHLRVMEIPAHRGMILDRNGEPLAVSTPVDSVWMNPQELSAGLGRLPELARALNMPGNALSKLVRDNHDKEFVYLARGLDPYEIGRAHV